MEMQWGLFIIYMMLAAGACAHTWNSKVHGLRFVGLALVLGWALSNIAWFFAPPPVKGIYDLNAMNLQVTLYTVIEIGVAVCALGVWLERSSAVMIRIVWACTISTMVNVWLLMETTLSSAPGPMWWQLNMHEIGTNGCFIVECVLAMWAGWSFDRGAVSLPDCEHGRTRDIDLVAQLDADPGGRAETGS
jgi:hypothetical protein